MRRTTTPLLLAAATLVGGCGLTRVDAPLSFAADRRLSLTSPGPEAVVQLPLRITWKASGFAAGVGGRHFGVFIDRVPIGPGKVLRRRVCSEKEKLPVNLGEVRKPCHDDADVVLESATTFVDVRCLQPHRGTSSRQEHRHTAAVVLLDGGGRRVGQAVSSVSFRVATRSAAAGACRRGTDA